MKPRFWNKGILYLSKKDSVLKSIIASYPNEYLTINSNYLSYHNCMSQTKSSYISKEGVAHISAQCRIFILEKAFTNK